MTTVDGFPVSPELVDFLKVFAPGYEHEETSLTSYIETLGDIQKYFCRNLDFGNEKALKQIAVFLESVTYMQDDLSKLAKLLPLINREN